MQTPSVAHQGPLARSKSGGVGVLLASMCQRQAIQQRPYRQQEHCLPRNPANLRWSLVPAAPIHHDKQHRRAMINIDLANQEREKQKEHFLR